MECASHGILPGARDTNMHYHRECNPDHLCEIESASLLYCKAAIFPFAYSILYK